MILVRNSFVAKPGQASRLAAQIKEASAVMNVTNPRVMTDLTGDFNHVVFEFTVDNLAQWEASLKDYHTNQEFRAKMAGYTDLWLTGTRELLEIVG
jgi:hypothetical protein